MTTSKPFKTYNQQLKILRSRNISIDIGNEGSKVKRILSRENYYSIINGYKSIFIDKIQTKASGEDYFISGTTFFHIYEVYCFDRALRGILLAALLQAEKGLKTKVSYRFSEKYQQPFSHLNINNFSKTDMQLVTKLISKLSSTTQNNTNAKTKDGEFYHYLTKHQDLPLWVLSNRMTFGEILFFFTALHPTLKETILKDFIDDFKYEYNEQIDCPLSSLLPIFDNMLHALVSFRNICAHEDRLYNHVVKKSKRTNGKSKTTIISIDGTILNKSGFINANLLGVITILKFFITSKAYSRLIKDVVASITMLSKSIPPHALNTVTREMGLSSNWRQQLKNLK